MRAREHRRELAGWWLIPLAPLFLTGLFLYVVAGATAIALACGVGDGVPALSAQPYPAAVGVDQAFAQAVLAIDHQLVGLVALSSPWWALVPGLGVGMIWEWVT